MKTFYLFCFLILSNLTLFGQEIMPQGVKVKISDPTLAGYSADESLAWHRWTTKNYTIMSISEDQGKWLYKNVEDVNGYCSEKWGIKEFKFPLECRIFCVSDKDLFKKLFAIEQSKVEYRENEKIVVVWLLLNDKPEKTLPIYITQAILNELEVKLNRKFNWSLINGMSLLNDSLDSIKSNLTENQVLIQKDTPMFFSKALLEMSEEAYFAQNKEIRHICDCQSVAFVLFLRKEFGQYNFLKLLTSSYDSKLIKEIYGFDSYDQLDSSFKRYMLDLSKDIANKKTPDDYLLITPVSNLK